MHDSAFIPSFGARLVGSPDNPRTLFRLWAPNAHHVAVEIDGLAPVAMRGLSGGWFEAEAPCGAGARYRYRVRDDLAIPDPASRLQDGDVHDASIVCDPLAYQWQNPLWRGRPWHETVLYELHPGACGGFEGIMQRLPELAALGVTAIELMPIADFPGPRNWGYDGVLPYAPDSSYGTPAQLAALIDRAHGLDLMVFLDVVYNHFGPDGNYLGAYAADFFRDDIETPWGQAIDFRKRQVRAFFTENALAWLIEYRFDGLRLDAVHAISEKDWLVELAERVRAHIDPDRHVHLVLENDDNLAHLLARSPRRLYDAQWNDDIHHALHVLLSGEHEGYYAAYADQPAGRLARALAEGFIYQGEPSSYAHGAPRGEPSAHLPPTSFVGFLQNHDQVGNRAFGERLIMLADPHALRAAYVLLLLSPHIPLLFMGEEFGARQPFLYFTSHLTEDLAHAVRDGRRQEFVRFPAFSDPATRARIPDPNAEQTFIDSIPLPDPGSGAHWQRWVQQLLRVRCEHLFSRLEGTRSLGASAVGPAAVLARWRLGDGSVLQLAVNLGGAAVPLDPLSCSTLLVETEGARASVVRGELPAYAAFVSLEAVR
jgi:maltooligosyltrehalose trehalohydrolase